MLRTLVTVAILLATPAFLCAQDLKPREDATVKELNMGTHWYGAPASIDQLQGKVVLFVFWGS